MYKELTTSVVPKYTDNNKTWSDLLIFTQYMLHLRFDSDRDSIGEPYMSESSDPHGYVVTTPINRTDR